MVCLEDAWSFRLEKFFITWFAVNFPALLTSVAELPAVVTPWSALLHPSILSSGCERRGFFGQAGEMGIPHHHSSSTFFSPNFTEGFTKTGQGFDA